MKESRAKRDCICGRKHLETWFNGGNGYFIKCPKCGMKVYGPTLIGTIRNWNSTIQTISGENDE